MSNCEFHLLSNCRAIFIPLTQESVLKSVISFPISSNFRDIPGGHVNGTNCTCNEKINLTNVWRAWWPQLSKIS